MKSLLADAIQLYDQGKLDEAQTALYTVEKSGADLGWQDNAKPEKYQRLIAEKRIAAVQPVATSPVIRRKRVPGDCGTRLRLLRPRPRGPGSCCAPVSASPPR